MQQLWVILFQVDINWETQKQQKLISVALCKTALKSNENSKIDNGKFIAIMCLFKNTLTDQQFMSPALQFPYWLELASYSFLHSRTKLKLQRNCCSKITSQLALNGITEDVWHIILTA